MARSRRETAPSTRDRAKLETREALLAAALALIPERGLDVSLDDICERAGFTRGAFYVHFRDRDALLAAVMERVGGGVLDALIGATGEGADLGALVAGFEAAFASGAYPLTRAGGVRPYQLLDACARSVDVRRQYTALVAESVRRLGRGVAAGQRKGALRGDVRADDLALLLVALVIGVQTLADVEAPLDLARAGRAVLRLFSGDVAVKPSRAARARRTRRT